MDPYVPSWVDFGPSAVLHGGEIERDEEDRRRVAYLQVSTQQTGRRRSGKIPEATDNKRVALNTNFFIVLKSGLNKSPK